MQNTDGLIIPLDVDLVSSLLMDSDTGKLGFRKHGHQQPAREGWCKPTAQCEDASDVPDSTCQGQLPVPAASGDTLLKDLTSCWVRKPY